MKWYFWALAIIAAIVVYELSKKLACAIFLRIWRVTIKAIRKAVTWCILQQMRTLRAWHTILLPSPEQESPYASLTPTAAADQHHVYENVLLSGLARSDVQNIALCGPYGSGKSSIIRTFMRRHPEYRYLNISLAAISPDIGQAAAMKKKESAAGDEASAASQAVSENGLIRNWTAQLSEQIEYSILQQMFYYVRERHIPFSRFKRVKGTSRLSLLLPTLALFLILLAASYLFIFVDTTPLPEDWAQWLKKQDKTLRPLCWLTLLLSSLGLIYYMLHLYRNAQLIKINLHNAQLEISPRKDASALNKHLDEILYFFAEVPIDIVVIEDLDRFEIPEIFVKLREINALINNAMEVGRKVTFIYALRDDVFTDEQRTKFFDLIAPVIPVTNASNAAAMLNQEITKMALPRPIPASFLNDLGFFIQDTRLLLNITNEFRIYQAQLQGFDINYTQLLAIIIYKNKYPSDFAKLQYNEGMVYEHFENKSIYIQKIIASLQIIRDQITLQLEQLKQTQLKTIVELRLAYLAQLHGEIHNMATHGFNGEIIVNGQPKSLLELVQSPFFDALRNERQIFFQSYSGNQYNSRLNFETIEKQVGQWPYEQRAAVLPEGFDVKREKWEKELEQVNQWIREVRNYSMKEIMSQAEMRQIDTPIKNHPLLVYLISNDYLNENYSYYLSQFTEGELTKGDFDFLWSIKHRKPLEWGHALDKLPALMKRLDVKEFSQPEMLNFDITAYLVAILKEQDEILSRFMEQLRPLDERAVQFIDQYIERRKAVPEMVRTLCHHVPSLWRFIQLESDYPTEKINQYLRLIISHCDPTDIEQQNDRGNLAAYMARQAFLLAPEANELDPSVLQAFCEATGVLFDLSVGELRPEPEMISYIHVCHRYKLNPRMITLLLENLLEDYDGTKMNAAQYTYILQSDLDQMKAYIDEHFEHYITEVFLKIEYHNEESEATMLRILNSGQLKDEVKQQVIATTTFELTDITACEDVALWDTLMQYVRVEPSWTNVVHYYGDPAGEEEEKEEEESAGLTEMLINFVNLPQTVAALTKRKLTDNDEDHDASVLLVDLIRSGKLSEYSILQYSGAIDFKIYKMDFAGFSDQYAGILIKHDKVGFDIAGVNSLKLHFPVLAADWIMANWNEFVDIFDKVTLSAQDWTNLLIHPNLNANQRQLLLARLPKDKVISVLENGVAITDVELESKKVAAEFDALKRLVSNNRINRNSVALILKNNLNNLEVDQVRAILLGLGGDFASLANGQVQIKVEKSTVMEQLLGELQASEHLVTAFEPKNKYIHVTLQPPSSISQS